LPEPRRDRPMPGVRAEFGVAADPEVGILAARRRGKRFRGASRYRAARWIRASATEHAPCLEKVGRTGRVPSRPR